MRTGSLYIFLFLLSITAWGPSIQSAPDRTDGEQPEQSVSVKEIFAATREQFLRLNTIDMTYTQTVEPIPPDDVEDLYPYQVQARRDVKRFQLKGENFRIEWGLEGSYHHPDQEIFAPIITYNGQLERRLNQSSLSMREIDRWWGLKYTDYPKLLVAPFIFLMRGNGHDDGLMVTKAFVEPDRWSIWVIRTGFALQRIWTITRS